MSLIYDLDTALSKNKRAGNFPANKTGDFIDTGLQTQNVQLGQMQPVQNQFEQIQPEQMQLGQTQFGQTQLGQDLQQALSSNNNEGFGEWLGRKAGDTYSSLISGAGSMLSNTALGGAAFGIANLGSKNEAANAFTKLARNAGATEEQIAEWKDKYFADNPITDTGAKWLLGKNAEIQKSIDDYYKQAVPNPDAWDRAVHGLGTTVGFSTAGALAAAMGNLNPVAAGLMGALTGGGLEALSETGDFLTEAYQQGKYDEAIPIANRDFLTNAALNTALEFGAGKFNPLLQKINNPYLKWLAETGAEVAQEAVLQEPLQGVIEEAAKNTLNNGEFLQNLAESVKTYPEKLREVGLDTAASTLLSQALLGGAGAAYNRAVRGQGQTEAAIKALNDQTAQAKEQLEIQHQQQAQQAQREALQRDINELERMRGFISEMPQSSELKTPVRQNENIKNIDTPIVPSGVTGDDVRPLNAPATLGEAINDALKNPVNAVIRETAEDTTGSPIQKQISKSQSMRDTAPTTAFSPSTADNVMSSKQGDNISAPYRDSDLNRNISQHEHSVSEGEDTDIQTDKKWSLPDGYTVEGAEDSRNIKGAKKHQFVLRNGKRDWGYITEELADGRDDIPVGAVRVQVGQKGWGLRHVVTKHMKDALGKYKSVEEFIAHIIDDGNEIIPLVPDKKGRPSEFLIARVQGAKKNDAIVISWNADEGYYTLKSAYTAGDEYLEKQKTLSSRDYTSTSSPASTSIAYAADKTLLGDSDATRYEDSDINKTISQAAAGVQNRHGKSDAAKITQDMLDGLDNEGYQFGGRDNGESEIYEQNRPREISDEHMQDSYGHAGILKRLKETGKADRSVRSLVLGMDSAADAVAELEKAVKKGKVDPHMSITGNIIKAANRLNYLKKHDISVPYYLKNADKLGATDMTDVSRELLKFFNDNRGSGDKIAAGLSKYAELAMNSENGDKKTLLKKAIQYAGSQYGYSEDKAAARLTEKIEKAIADLHHPDISREDAGIYAPFIVNLHRYFARNLGISLDEVMRMRGIEFTTDEKPAGNFLSQALYEQLMHHGTRHNLGGRFDLTKIGTGEGTQMYGWGIYLAENPEVAETYRRMGADVLNGFVFTDANGKTHSVKSAAGKSQIFHDFIADLAREEIIRKMGFNSASLSDSVNNAISELENKIRQREDKSKSLTGGELAEYDKATDAMKAGLAEIKEHKPVSVKEHEIGNLYKVEGPENDVLLDWDAKLSEQPKQVKKAIREVIAEIKEYLTEKELANITDNDAAGKDLYLWGKRALERKIGDRRSGDYVRPDRAMSELLNKHGILGHRYLDEQSRLGRSKNRTHNFVIWDTELLKIMGVEGDAAEVESYSQPVNPNVNLDTTFKVEPLKLTGEIPDRQTLMNKLRGLASSGEMITRDELAAISVGSSKKIRHVVQSSRNIGALDAKAQEIRQRSLLSIDELIPQSVLVESAPNMKTDKKPNVAAYHRFYVPVATEDGEYYKVRIVAEEEKGTQNIRPIGVTLYDLVTDGKEGVSSPTTFSSNENRIVVDTETPSLNISLRDLLRNVNDADGKPYLDINGNPAPSSEWQRARYEDWVQNTDDLHNQYTQTTDKNGAIRRGYVEFLPEQRDALNKIVKDAHALIHMLKNGDKSTLIHEPAHAFFEFFKDISQDERLSDAAKGDWAEVLKFINMEDVDFSKPLSDADKKRWHNGQEKLAAGAEKYFITGKAPNARLKRLFDIIKGWIRAIYNAAKNIVYTDSEGRQVPFKLTKEMHKVYENIFSGGENMEKPLWEQERAANLEVGEADPAEYFTPEKLKDNVFVETGEPALSANADVSYDPSGLPDNIPNGEGQEVDTLPVNKINEVDTTPNPSSVLNVLNEERQEGDLGAIDSIDENDYRLSGAGSEERFRASREDVAYRERLRKAWRSGAFKELKKASQSGADLAFARAHLHTLIGNVSGATGKASRMTKKIINGLKASEVDLFTRKRILDDLTWRKGELPDAKLPWGMDDESLKRDYERITRLVEKNEKIMNAIKQDEAATAEINGQMIKLARKLGMNDLAKVLRNPHYFHHEILFNDAQPSGNTPNEARQGGDKAGGKGIDALINIIKNRGYMKKYKGSELDMSSNYLQVTSDVRGQQLQDLEIMKTLVNLKNKYDIGDDLRAKLNKFNGVKNSGDNIYAQSEARTGTREDGNGGKRSLRDVIPDGYAVYDPSAHGLISSGGNNQVESLLSLGLEDTMQKMGLTDSAVNEISEALADKFDKLWVIPKEIKSALTELEKIKQPHGVVKLLKKITGGWKTWVLFSPTMNIKYNLRNLTGDADAVLAGNPRAYEYAPRAVKDLFKVFFMGKDAEGDLADYMNRGGGLGTETGQLFFDFYYNTEKEMREALRKLEKAEGESMSEKLKHLPKDALRALDKYGWHGIQHVTEYRENILRYATYLSYLDQMKKNKDGSPDNWGASLKEEVMALPDIKDRAYKMANELLGDYDNVSELGQQLRDLAIPFYSWLEVNARRYYRLFKNGLSSDSKIDFAANFLKGTGLKAPLYAWRLGKTYLMLNLFTLAVKAFNHLVFPDAEEDLPPDVKERPHITLGYTSDGSVSYFDRIGSMLDILDWVGQDDPIMPFASDIKDILNGQQTITGLLKKAGGAAFSKAINAVNPLFTMPFEIATGRTIYPDATHPRTIKDIQSYVAQSIGLSREWNAIRGEPGHNYFSWDRAKSLFKYTVDPKEGAYFYILDKVRQFQEKELGKSFDGSATTPRGEVLRKLKTSIRFKDKANIRRYLRRYYQLGGSDKGLKASIERMNPLASLSKDDKAQFMKQLSPEDRKYLRRAFVYFSELASTLGVK